MRISAHMFLFVLLMLPAAALAQTAIPLGTILPAQLSTSLDSQKTKVGQKVTARIMQDVPGTKVHAGAKLIGHVIEVKVATSQPAQITLRLDTINLSQERVLVNTSLRALVYDGGRRRADTFGRY